MKKHVFSLGLMLVAALAFTNCAKQEVIAEVSEQLAGVPFELTAGVDTKTEATDAGVITWAEGDKLNVFHAEAGSTAYGSNDDFSFDTGSSFKGTLQDGALTADAYDWYALYPYNKYIETPANTSSGYLPIGTSGVNKSTGVAKALTQQGNSNKAHLAGEYFPLYGKVENVAADEKPSVTMNQAMSILKIHVTNASEDALTVASVSVTAPEDIVGTYYIDFSGEAPVFKASGADYVSKTANLTVTDGAAIAKTESADFYVAVKPFTQAATGVLTVSVNGYEKEITLPAGTEFKPGKIKTVNFAYDYVSIAEPTAKTGWYRVEDASWLKAGDRVLIAANAYDVAMSTTQNTNNRGQVAVTKSTDGVYSKLTAGDDVQMFILEEGTVENSFAFKADNGDTADGYIYAASSGSNHLKTQDAKDGNASFTIAIDTEGNASVVAQGTYTRNVMQYNSSSSIFACYGSASQSAVAIYKYYGTYVVAPVISVTSANPMNVSKDGEVATISYSIANPTGESISAVSNQEWVNTFDFSTDGEISFIVDAQAPGADARSAEITLSYEGAADVVVTVNQAAGAGADVDYVLTFGAGKNSKGVSGYSNVSFTVNDSLNTTWTISNWNNNNNGWEYVKAGSKNAACTGTMTTNTAISDVIKSGSVVIDAITASKVTTLTMTIAKDKDFTQNVQTISIDKSTGTKSFSITTPTADAYYKLTASCSKSSNGVITISKVTLSTKALE